MLLRGKTETIPYRKEALHLEQATQEKMDTFDSPRVLSSHLWFEELPREVMQRKTKIIYLLRDPRDCLASLYTLVRKNRKVTRPDWYIPFPEWVELSNSGQCK